MRKRNRNRTKVCIACGQEKPMADFTHKNSRCDKCREAGHTETNVHYRMQRGLVALEERVRWKNARRVKGYRFTGEIPQPKDYQLQEAYAEENWRVA